MWRQAVMLSAHSPCYFKRRVLQISAGLFSRNSSSSTSGYEQLLSKGDTSRNSLVFCSIYLVLTPVNNYLVILHVNRSQWPPGLRRVSAAALLLGQRVRTPPGAWMFVSCDCCVLSGRGLCIGLISLTDCGVYNWVWSWILDKDEALAQ